MSSFNSLDIKKDGLMNSNQVLNDNIEDLNSSINKLEEKNKKLLNKINSLTDSNKSSIKLYEDTNSIYNKYINFNILIIVIFLLGIIVLYMLNIGKNVASAVQGVVPRGLLEEGVLPGNVTSLVKSVVKKFNKKNTDTLLNNIFKKKL
tara:strand:+ start:342 stop:785 length:444 start_codon:yes stop_codon:yes gene_type:complete